MRKKMTAVILAVLVFSLIAASAATLGGITTAQVGADVQAVTSCDSTGVVVDYNTSYDATAGEYLVDDVVVSGIDAPCVGQTISVTLSDGTAEEERSLGPIASGSETVAGFSFSAEDLTVVAIVIS